MKVHRSNKPTRNQIEIIACAELFIPDLKPRAFGNAVNALMIEDNAPMNIATLPEFAIPDLTSRKQFCHGRYHIKYIPNINFSMLPQ